LSMRARFIGSCATIALNGKLNSNATVRV